MTVKEPAFPLEELNRLLSYNPETGVLSWREQGFFSNGKPRTAVAGNIDSRGYRNITIKGRKMAAHRICWALHYGVWPPKQIDHININPLDNRIENLRLATSSQNNANRRAIKSNKPKGITLAKGGKKWQGQIRLDRKIYHLGVYETKDEAAHAYNKKAVEFFGEFAVLNPIGEPKPCEAIPASNKEQA